MAPAHRRALVRPAAPFRQMHDAVNALSALGREGHVRAHLHRTLAEPGLRVGADRRKPQSHAIGKSRDGPAARIVTLANASDNLARLSRRPANAATASASGRSSSVSASTPRSRPKPSAITLCEPDIYGLKQIGARRLRLGGIFDQAKHKKTGDLIALESQALSAKSVPHACTLSSRSIALRQSCW